MIVTKEAIINDRAMFDFIKEYEPRVFRCGFCACEFIAEKTEYSKIIAGNKTLPESYVVTCPSCDTQKIYNKFDTIDPSIHDLKLLLTTKRDEANKNKIIK